MTHFRPTRSTASTLRGVLVGCVVVILLGVALSTTARALWPAYAIAEPTRAYSLVMLISRLTAGACIVVLAAIAATRASRDDGRSAWWLGALFFVVSFVHHVFQVWAEYPVWYHLLYLAYLLPLSGFAGRVGRAPTVTD